MATAFSMEEAAVVVVVVPFPAQGHLNTLLCFSLLLSSRGLPVHYAAPAAHIRQAKSRCNSTPTSLQTIHFHPLPIPPFSSPPPDPASKFPTHLQPLFDATPHLRSPLAALLQSLSPTARRLVVVHEPLMYFAGNEAAKLPNAETYTFTGVSAIFRLSLSWPSWPSIPPGVRREVADLILAPFDPRVSNEFWDLVNGQDRNVPVEAGGLINSCRALEGEFIDLLARLPNFAGKKLFTVGPLHLAAAEEDGSQSRHEVMNWLDGQPADSVLYVSFGTNAPISDSEMGRLAAGLKGSGQRFIWVLREPDRGDIFAGGEESRGMELLPGLEKEVKGVGLVVREWAPQLQILAHPSTGGFMSHCGWNSCMESLSNGVPILAWPMHSDQPKVAMLVTEHLKVGVMVGDDRGELAPPERIEEAIKRVMVYEEGKEIRRRAKSLGEEVRMAMAEGGSSREEMDSFIAHITR